MNAAAEAASPGAAAPRRIHRRAGQARAWLRVVVVVLLLALVEAALVQHLLADEPARTTLWFWTSLFEVSLWIALAPVTIALARRFPVDLRDRSWRNLLLHVIFSLMYGVIECGIRTLASLLVMPGDLAQIFPAGPGAFFARQLVSFLMVEAMVYWSIVVVIQWWDSERRRRSAEAEAATARMLAVQQSLAPHFTLNALNALVAMLPEASREQRFAIAIGGFMHDLLVASDRPTQTFGEEMAMVERYLAVERERLGERLRLSMDIAPGLDAIEVPVLALQPLFENAVRYAVAPFRDGGSLRFVAYRDNGELLLRLESEASEPFRPLHGFGHGEASVRARFELLHGRRFWFRSGRRGPSHYSVTMGVGQV